MKLRHYLSMAALAITLTACGMDDKFPYPPQFVGTQDVAPTVLAAPPAKTSTEYKKALESVLLRQKHLSAREIAVIKAEDHISPEMLVQPVLGDSVTRESAPLLYAHLAHAASDAWRITDATQDYWNNTRPWLVDSRVTLHVERITRPSYPSGHTVTNSVWAYVLGDLIPCQQSALLKRASAIGYHRVEAGAHFPFDVEAGKKLAKVIYGKMTASPAYQAEHEAVRAELAASMPAAKQRACR